MNSEKVKEIKKVLEQNSVYIPFFNECEVYYADLLTLINELESENESLQDLCNKTYEDLTKEIDRLEREIDDLKLEVQKAHNKGVQAGFDMTKFKEESIKRKAKKYIKKSYDWKQKESKK